MTDTTQRLRLPTPPPAHARPRRRLPLGLLAVLGAADVIGLGPARLPLVSAAAGVGLVLVLPALVIYQKISWPPIGTAARALYSGALALVALLLVGLAVNTALPWLSVGRPLDAVPLTVTVNVEILALAAWRPSRVVRIRVPGLPPLRRADEVVIGAAFVAVGLSVVGAIRLNNGAGPAVAMAMLVLAGGALVWLLALNHRLHPATFPLVLYLVGVALLLMTSLRGWYITGHDIQREYRVFQLAESDGRWNMDVYKDAYNACLSITIMPVMIAKLTGVNSYYVYKAVYQLLFALCPVMVYLISLRFVTRRLAVLASVYFMAFPTYFTDMPFLCRQEVAFIFVGVSLMVITERAASVPFRRVLLGLFSVGMVLSHYSTTYVFAVLITLTWLGLRARTGWGRLRARTRPGRPATGAQPSRTAVIGVVNVAVILLASVLWNGVLTHTSHGLTMTIQNSVRGLTGQAPESKSSDVSYGLLSGAQPSPRERLESYSNATMSQTMADHRRAAYYPAPLVERYPVRVVGTTSLPVTAAGRAIGHLGVGADTLNSLLRQGGARLMQIFVLFGLAVATASRRVRSRIGAEYLLLGWVSIAIVASQVVLPSISEDYGVLRAFQQALFVVAPALAAGADWAFRWAGRRLTRRIGESMALVLFMSCVGLLPQLLGGYPPQLNLNNAGLYYQIYYIHPDEVAGIAWLSQNSSAGNQGDVQSEVQTDRYTFTKAQNFAQLNVFNDIYPTLIRKDAYVFLGDATTTRGLSTVSYQGDLVTYRYPIDFLRDTKSLVYTNGGAEIFR